MEHRWESKDEFTKGIIAGLLASIPKHLFVQIAQWLNLIKVDNNFTALDVTLTQFNYSVGEVVFALITGVAIPGVFFGLILAFLFSKVFTHRLYIIKGMIYGLIIWILEWGMMRKVFDYPSILENSLSHAVVFGMSLAVYGVVTAYLLNRMGIFDDIRKHG